MAPWSRRHVSKAAPVMGPEVGATGLKASGGVVREEYLPVLQGAKGLKVYTEMGTDPVIGASLLALEMLIRRVEWTVTPGGEDPEDIDRAEFADSLRDDMSHSWGEFMGEAMTMLQYGFAPFEIVYKQRHGHVRDNPGESSQHSDGRIGWRKLAIRAQDTVARWDLDPNGGIQGMFQMVDGRGQVPIPIEKMVLFRTTSHKGNPEGRSVLRSAYTPWFFGKRAREFEGIGLERDLAGIPKFGVPAALLDPNANPEQKAALRQFEEIGRNLRADAQAFVLYPLEYDARGNKRYEIELMSSAGSRRQDTDKIITRYNLEKALAILTDVLLVGHERVGTQSLATVKSELLTIILNTWLGDMADVLNRHALPRVFALNGMSVENLPRFTPGPVEDVDLAQVLEVIRELSQAGGEWFPNPPFTQWVADRLGVPAPPEELDPNASREDPDDDEDEDPPEPPPGPEGDPEGA